MTREEILRQQLQAEQAETARELAGLLRLGQEMSRRLGNETHGDLYDDVRTLMSLLHQTRAQADLINEKINLEDAANYSITQQQGTKRPSQKASAGF